MFWWYVFDISTSSIVLIITPQNAVVLSILGISEHVYNCVKHKIMFRHRTWDPPFIFTNPTFALYIKALVTHPMRRGKILYGSRQRRRGHTRTNRQMHTKWQAKIMLLFALFRAMIVHIDRKITFFLHCYHMQKCVIIVIDITWYQIQEHFIEKIAWWEFDDFILSMV